MSDGLSDDLRLIWDGDLLGRAEDAEFLERFMFSQIEKRGERRDKSSYVLNLDADWGQGKTFFMERLAKQIERSGHQVVFINAWENDFIDDPFTAVMAAFDPLIEAALAAPSTGEKVRAKAEILKKHAGKVLLLALTGATKKGISKMIGEGAEEISRLLEKEGAAAGAATGAGTAVADAISKSLDEYAQERLSQFRDAHASLQAFRTELQNLLEAIAGSDHHKLPIFVFVDELDRCRPTYAISMLERIKHLFDVPGLVFLVSTDSTQLANAVAGAYGPHYDGRRYLQRFFHQTFVLPTPSAHQIVDAFFERVKVDQERFLCPGRTDHPKPFINQAHRMFQLSVRELIQSLELFEVIIATWNSRASMEISVLFPLIIAHIRKEGLSSYENAAKWLREAYNQMPSWTVEDYVGVGQGHQDVAMHRYANAVLSMAERPLQIQLAQHEEVPASAEDAHVMRLVESETGGRFGQLRMGSQTMSHVRRYPAIVRQAGYIGEGREH